MEEKKERKHEAIEWQLTEPLDSLREQEEDKEMAEYLRLKPLEKKLKSSHSE